MDTLTFKSDDSEQFSREESTESAVYNVYLKKVQYNTLTDDAVVEDKKARLQWRLEECRVIKYGTLEKLVAAMCHSTGDLDSIFVDTFLGTYRSFASAKELMETISKRYADIGDAEGRQVMENCRRSLKMVLIVWLDMYPEDFRDPPVYPALSLLEKFARENLPESDLMQKVCEKKCLFLKQEEEGDAFFGPVEDLAVMFRHCILDSIREAASKKSVSTSLKLPLDVLSVPSKVFAEQLTFMDAELFRKVVPYHCLGSVWSRRSEKKQAVPPVTVYATVNQFNAVSHRVIATILKWPYKNATDRAAVIEKWIDIAQECRILKNFSSLKAVISGLQSSSAYRLKSVWHIVPRDKINLFKELANIFNEDNNHGLWRELLIREGTAKFVEPNVVNTLRGGQKKKGEGRKMSFTDLANQGNTMQGTVPYLGTFLTDLTMVDTAFKDFIQDDLINFEKKRKEFELMAQIQLLQSSAGLYRIEPDHVFFDWFYSIRVYDDNESHELSCEIEPNDSYLTVDRRTHKKNASLGYFVPRRPSSMEDLQLFRGSISSLSRDLDEDSKSVSNFSEILASNKKTPEFRHSISLCSLKSSEIGTGSVSGTRRIVTGNNSLVAKVYLRSSENHHTNNYKCILLNNNDHAHTVLRNILLKYNVSSKPEDFVLYQQLPNNSEMLLPERGNIFYAIKNDVDDVIFVVRKRAELGRHKFKQHNRTKDRISKFIMNV